MFHTKSVGTFMVYLNTNFHISSSNASLVTYIELKAK
jgi:hypothetical protein